MSNGFVYIVSGGIMRPRIVRIGYTEMLEGLMDTFTTHYGQNISIHYVPSPHAFDGEGAIRAYLITHHNNIGSDLYACRLTDAKNIIRAYSGNARIKKL